MKNLITLFFLFFSVQAFASRDLILVPGFFSSAIPAPSGLSDPWNPPYFSQGIVDYLRRSGNHVWVVDNLNPVGGVEENGQRLIQFLAAHRAQMTGDSFLLIAHSAGGLYSLYAAANSDLPISQIIAVSTPFMGLQFLQTLEDQHIPVDSLTAPFLLKNLSGLKAARVQSFLAGLRLKKALRLDVFSSYQQASLEFWDWHYLSEPLVPFQVLNGEASDGIVTIRSALAAGALRAANPTLNLQIHPNPIPLEHWEFILDANLTRVFGTIDITGLQNAQNWAYYNILKQSGF